MGIYLNPSNVDFQESLNSEEHLNRIINIEQKYVYVNRPRRFDKSMTLKLLNTYYNCACNSKDLCF